MLKTKVFVCLLFPFITTLGCAQKQLREEQQPSTISTTTSNQNYASYLCSLKLPERLSLFGEKVPLENAEVKERAEREFYSNVQQSAQMILNIKRTQRYFALFSKILAEEGIPDDFKYMAVAESALYMARSPKDAMGLWQFIEATARRYGLEVSESVDERRHVEKSTRAAAAFLKEAHKRFGTWTMAAAAYNMGIEGAQRNVETQGSSNYYDLFFNEETSRYILRIAVIKEMIEQSSKYGITIDIADRYAEEPTKAVKVYSSIDNVTTWARERNCSYKDLRLLNPWIIRNYLVKPKNGFWEILLPK